MIHIVKGEEPQELRTYRDLEDINKSYNNFREKDSVRESLLEEQGFLCAYCMRAIGYERSKWYKEVRIEHYRCRDDFGDLQLNYDNMFAVCTCSKGLKEKEQHCDVSKGNKFIHIDPKKEEHISTLRYSEGGVLSTDPQFSEDIETTLGLNQLILQSDRRETLNSVVSAMKKQIEKGLPIEQVVDKTWGLYSLKDIHGKRKPYCGIVIAYCEKIKRRLEHANP